MSHGELFISNLCQEQQSQFENLAALLPLTVNHANPVDSEWLKCDSANKVLLHCFHDVSLGLAKLDTRLLESGIHIAICQYLDVDTETRLLGCGFHGALTSDAAAHTKLEAFKLILDGQLSFSNSALSQYILRLNRKPMPGRQSELLAKTTPKEQEVLNFVCNGLSNDEVAKRLNVSINTIKMHLQNIYKKTNIRNRGQLLLTFNQG